MKVLRFTNYCSLGVGTYAGDDFYNYQRMRLKQKGPYLKSLRFGISNCCPGFGPRGIASRQTRGALKGTLGFPGPGNLFNREYNLLEGPFTPGDTNSSLGTQKGSIRKPFI